MRKLNIHWNPEDVTFDQVYWFGNINGKLDRNILLFFDIFRYHIWCNKRMHVFPDLCRLVDGICSTLATIFTVKPLIKSNFRKSTSLAGVLQAIG
jgi:hypothetical protein